MYKLVNKKKIIGNDRKIAETEETQNNIPNHFSVA